MRAAEGRLPQPGTMLLVLLGVALLGWAVINSPLFGTRTILVRGVRQLDAAQVRQISGVQMGANLLRVSLDRVADFVERAPWVADATASRSLPSTLVITVAERRPVGWLQDTEGRVVVAADGVVVERPASPPRAVPWLGRFPSALTPGGRLPSRPLGLDVARALTDRALRRVRTITVAGEDVLLLLRGGGEVQYGAAEQLQEKGRALDSMLRWADRQGVQVASVDVRIPESPALLPVS
jgi:cell division protein FtsQ